MKSFSLSELSRAPGQIVDAALAAPAGLTKHGKRKLVVMNAVEYELLKHGKAFRIEDAPDVINDVPLEGLTQALNHDA
jgi:hypothetical protein